MASKFKINDSIKINNDVYTIIKLLGHGKGGYSYLALSEKQEEVVLKEIHHEPCDYYNFGNKIESELNDYQRLLKTGIRIPKMITYDIEQEILIKEYIKGETILKLKESGIDISFFLKEVKEFANKAKEKGLNIDYYPSNFIPKDNKLYYIDYECNEYMEKWSFEVWGENFWR